MAVLWDELAASGRGAGTPKRGWSGELGQGCRNAGEAAEPAGKTGESHLVVYPRLGGKFLIKAGDGGDVGAFEIEGETGCGIFSNYFIDERVYGAIAAAFGTGGA